LFLSAKVNPNLENRHILEESNEESRCWTNNSREGSKNEDERCIPSKNKSSQQESKKEPSPKKQQESKSIELNLEEQKVDDSKQEEPQKNTAATSEVSTIVATPV